MSNINNHNSGLTINVYNAPSRADLNLQKPNGSTIHVEEDDEFEDAESDGARGGHSAINKLPLPGWAKSFLKNVLANSSSAMPSSSEAARTLREFQKENGIDLLSSEDVQEMAETGYRTMPGGARRPVPRHIQAAAKKMMENNGKLFKKLQTAIRREHFGWLSAADYDAVLKDGSMPATDDPPMQYGLDIKSFLVNVMKGTVSHNRPTDYIAAKTVQHFQSENNIALVSVELARQIADTGYCTTTRGTRRVPRHVREAFMKMTEKNCQLFKRLETAIRKPADDALSQQDADQAGKDGGNWLPAQEGRRDLLALG